MRVRVIRLELQIDTKRVEFIQVVHWQTRQRWELPRMGEGSYLRWLDEREYELVEQQHLGRGEIEIYHVTGSQTYAVYFPFLVELDVECLLVEILTQNEVREIVANVRQRWQQMVGDVE
ncbi:hypothetical protein H6G17_09155 [Chroococcidiopsis sp. FACHB-1243]|uniref:hypothetical protein n=1 Tax=Chroococcidiopsis sp. [FACHB-1243] TaxID=2692781 RepID=UPI001780338E|nr:hypothetical protein [Chroococcidiopsis sp. [FACHB-1243]]MBD2305681.1 hypothetical protein [Chroococcidiopsis sp. [FACHB-1243]]